MADGSEDAPPLERKLVTVLSADVAEYSRLMAEDEERTLRIFREHSQTFASLVTLYHGRIFNTAGDAILAEFASAVEAVRCVPENPGRAAHPQRPDTAGAPGRFRLASISGDVMIQNSDLLRRWRQRRGPAAGRGGSLAEYVFRAASTIRSATSCP